MNNIYSLKNLGILIGVILRLLCHSKMVRTSLIATISRNPYFISNKNVRKWAI